MKKFAALALVLTFILCIFASCGKKRNLDGGEFVTDNEGNERAVATKEDGGYIRGSDGNVVILATDKDGNSYTDENGENVTAYNDFKTALVIGNLIELEHFYIELPDGWSNSDSIADNMFFKKDGTEDKIAIIPRKGSVSPTCREEYETARAAIIKMYPDARKDNFPVDINGETCGFNGVYVPKASNDKPMYYGETYITVKNYTYIMRVTSDRDIVDDIDTFVSIFSSVKFK
ncbi:MAG: hypothetical protein IJM02_00530 [Clostridia bacterium]|nr:hypothetical protein [Clostridia bacterium]